MPTAVETVTHLTISTGGSVLPQAISSRLVDLEVESTYNRPDVCFLSFDIDAKTEIPPQVELGKALIVAVINTRLNNTGNLKIFEGEVTALEFDSRDKRSVFVVQAEDKFHRFFRGDHTRTWLQSTIGDAVKQICKDVNVPATIKSTSAPLPFQMQQNVSDGAWLIERAGEIGYHVRVAAGTLNFDKVGAGGDSGVTLELGNHLIGFNCRATATTYVEEAVVRSWDVAQKKKIESKVPASAFTGRKDSKVGGAFPPGKVLLARSDLGSPDETKASAQAALDRAVEHNLQAEGRCFGNAKLVVDKQVTIKGVNTRFDGKYRISHLRHRYSHDEGFTTEFSCRGATDHSLSGIVSASLNGAPAIDRSVFEGAAVGIVTANDDPDGLGRVKVRLPSLSDDLTTDWMRIAFPGGGGAKHHGWYLLPDVDDEVLVIFERGDARRGYVLGGLHNGVDKPCYKNDKVLATGKDKGKVNQHAFRCNSGAHLLFDENPSEEVIEIQNKDRTFFFKYSSKGGVTLENKSTGDKMTITNKGDLTMVAESGNISIEAKAGKVAIKAAQDVSIESSSGKVAIKAAQDATVEGLNAKLTGQAGAEVKGKATATLESSGQTVVKGTMVMIN